MRMKRISLYDSLKFVPPEDNEEEKRQREQTAEALKFLIRSRLTHRQRQVIVLYYYKGLKQREIAKKLGVSESAVSHAKKCALERIRFYLEFIRR